jgi:carboxypeptidase C (cathepsin A)
MWKLRNLRGANESDSLQFPFDANAVPRRELREYQSSHMLPRSQPRATISILSSAPYGQ